jgi:hypothetical protein
MPDDELPCLCVANGLPPAAHEPGERCPSWDMLMYGNAYGYRDIDGKLNWLDPQDVVIKRAEHTVNRGNTVKPVTDYDDPPVPAKPSKSLVRKIVARICSPGNLAVGVIFSFLLAVFTHQHGYWVFAYLAGWFLSDALIEVTRHAYAGATRDGK